MNKLILSFFFIVAVACLTVTMKNREITPDQKTIVNSNALNIADSIIVRIR